MNLTKQKHNATPNGQWRKDLFTIVLSFGQWHASFTPPFLLIPSFKKSQNWQCALTLLTPHGWEAMPLTKQKHFWPLIDGMSIWQCFICPCQQLYHCLDPWLSFMHCLINWQQPESPSPRHCDSSKTHMTNKKGTIIEQWCEFPSTIISSLGQWHDVFVTFFVHSTFKIVKIDTFFTGIQGIDMKWKQGVTQLSNNERFYTIIVSLGQWNDVLATFLANLALVHRLYPVLGLKLPLAQKARPI